MDLPEPVSEARRYCRHSGVSEKRCFKDKAWMGVGDADGPSTWCTESRRPSNKGGDENEEGSDPELWDFEADRSNSSVNGLTTLAAVGGVTTSFERLEARFGDHGRSCFVTGVWKASPRTSPLLCILLSRRESLLANLSGLG